MQSLQVLKHVNDFAAKKITISPLNLGHTTEVTCFPLNNMVIMERADVAKLAGNALSRRSHLSWDNFDQFKFDVQNVCFVEKYVDPSLQVKIACSCPDGLKGSKPCSHQVAMEYVHELRPLPDLRPISKSVKKSGRPATKVAKQPRMSR